MNITEIKKVVTAIEVRVDKKLTELHNRINELDAKVDPAVEASRKSQWTPLIVAFIVLASLSLGIWLGLKF